MLEIGSLVDNKYRVLDVVGSGGMSTVYLARNEKANKSWAIKEVLKQGQEDLEIKKNSLIAETEMLKKLNHPNLPAIIDVIETDDTFLVVMDYIEGNDLGEIINEFGAQSQDKVIEWAKQVCDVLSYLHTRNPVIIYRDLKPANIMLKPDGNITLIDFGTAREAEIKDVANTVSLGTRGYAAPEQFGDGARADARTDIYCFGATIYHLVTGHSPAEEPYIIQPIREINPQLSGGLEKIILKCTMADPAQRYQDCEELMYDLEHYQEIDDLYKKKQHKKLWMFLISAILCVACAATSVFGYVKNMRQIENLYQKAFSNGLFDKAIQYDDTQKDAYLGLVDQFLKNDGVISEEEKLKFEWLKEYEKENSNGATVEPLHDLYNSNVNDYALVCYKIGFAMWNKYHSSTTNVSEAAVWFQKILPENYADLDMNTITEGSQYQITYNGMNEKTVSIAEGNDNDKAFTLNDFKLALICAQINNSVSSIPSTGEIQAGFNSILDKEDLKKAYTEYWSRLNTLLSLAQTMDDNMMVMLLCREIGLQISDAGKFKNLIEYNSLTKEQILDGIVLKTKELVNSHAATYEKESEQIITILNSAENVINQYFDKSQS